MDIHQKLSLPQKLVQANNARGVDEMDEQPGA